VLFVQGNRAVFVYNRIGTLTRLASSIELPTGACSIAVVFTKTAEHAGELTMRIDGVDAGSCALTLLPFRQALFGMDIGADHGSSVCTDYGAPFRFGGRLHHVDYALGTDRDDVRRAAAVEARNALVDQ
jgi:hypothetical protein